ncbi:HRDC domain-containing protein [Paenibacillus doosanensis]|nr:MULTISPECIES: HRDC domain-containing protein [Paenibacillus]MCS7462745.1 HRDC domain-containing protein [Paenibacillus doosanensis]
MNLLFLNSMEKQVGDDRTRGAQASIGESHGKWIAGWQETKEDGRLTHETWFEGTSWEELIAAFRERMLVKRHEGFKPVLDPALLLERVSLDSRSARIQLLQFYSEQHTSEELYEALRQWRLKQAGKEGKSPFLVATNRLLRMICAFLPHTEEELSQIPGFGANKAALYGAELLKFTRQYERTTSFPLDWVEDSVNLLQFQAWQQQEKQRKQQLEQTKRETKRRLLEAVTRGDSLEQLREELQLQPRDLMIWLEELDREGYDLEAYIELELKRVPEEELSLAWEAFELRGDKYLKPILQSLYKQEELDGKEVDRIYEWLRLLRMKFRKAQASQEQASQEAVAG